MLECPDIPAFCLDFDGCLAGLAATPGRAVVPVGLPAGGGGFGPRAGRAVALVSGRPLAGLRRFLPGLAVPPTARP